jgi:hypothetical protein
VADPRRPASAGGIKITRVRAVVEIEISAPRVDPVRHACWILARHCFKVVEAHAVEIGDTKGRDPAAPCTAFVEGEPATGSEADCETDGHYRCLECTRISVRALRRRREQCEDCGSPLARDACPTCDPTYTSLLPLLNSPDTPHA